MTANYLLATIGEVLLSESMIGHIVFSKYLLGSEEALIGPRCTGKYGIYTNRSKSERHPLCIPLCMSSGTSFLVGGVSTAEGLLFGRRQM